MTVGGACYKVAQIVFQKRDGSVFVTFPYYAHGTGLVSHARLDAHSSQLDLKPGGKVTSHLVKYAHHPDGEAHFSQSGKVLTRVRKTAVRLDEAGGHLFTVHIVGCSDFKAASESERARMPSTRRTLLNCDFGAETPRGIKIVGRLYTTASLKFEGEPPCVPGPVAAVQPDGAQRWAFPTSPPKGWPGDYRLLLLTAENWPADDYPDGPHVSFMGGFDRQDIARDTRQSTTVLALSYPIESYDELRRQLGSIDFAPAS
ncbi:MAG: hypothetical protein ACLP0J_25940 [Solirubrobacteraceae bacterium]